MIGNEESLARGAGPALSPVVRALRFAGDEVQLGLVLAEVCQDPVVAAAFANAVIARAQYGNPDARKRARRGRDHVLCLGEQQLQARVTRRLARARVHDVGRVDLRFEASNDWRLAVELKLNSSFSPEQLERYGEWGPVAAIVRDASRVTAMRNHPNWIGAANWASLEGDLRAFPVDRHWAPEWGALLDVMQSDGDFDVGIPSSREVQAQTALIRSLAQPVVEHLACELQRVYENQAKAAISGLGSTPVSHDRVWAGVGIDAQDGPWLWVAIRNLWGPAPRVRIEYYTFPDRRARRRLEPAHADIESRLRFERRGDYFRLEKPMPRLAPPCKTETLIAISEIVTDLVDSRVFDVEIERIDRHYR